MDPLKTNFGTNGWEEYKRLIVHEIDRNNDRLNLIDKRLSKIENKLAVIHTKIYFAAFLASTILTGIIQFFMSR